MKRIALLLAATLFLEVGVVYGQDNSKTYNQKGSEALEKKNYAEAFSWFKKSAEAGDAYGQYQLAFCYRNGEGVDKDEEHALHWFKASANGGCQYAYNPLGRMLERDNPGEAFSWYKKSADTGDMVGQYNLAMCYINGVGTDYNDVEAKKLFKESAAQGYKQATDRLTGMDEPDFKTPPIIDFFNLPSEVTTPNVKFDVKVRAKNGKVKDVDVYLNNQKTRGFRVVTDDGYDYGWKEEIKELREGRNSIRVEATNRAGKGTKEFIVNYRPVYMQERRLALVIGNSNYSVGNSLNNPINDATDMKNKLNNLGFDVIFATDANKSAMKNKVNEFANRAQNSDVALFFYAGHGMQCQGKNYLIPVTADIKSEADIEEECVSADWVLRKLDESRCKAKILFLDACRDNPYARSWYRGTTEAGLAQMKAPKGTFIGYSTGPDEVAKDGEGRNSPFTEALLRALDKKDLELKDLFDEVGLEVQSKTGQTPWMLSMFYNKFYFNKK